MVFSRACSSSLVREAYSASAIARDICSIDVVVGVGLVEFASFRCCDLMSLVYFGGVLDAMHMLI